MASPSEKSIFLSALDLQSPDERRDYLDRACADNPQLRDAVIDLLAAHERADNVLDSTPAQVGALRAKLDAASTGARTSAATGADSQTTPAEPPGTVIGSYKLVEQIGEGGFGHVYVAEQLHPVRRQVALKILKPGMHSEEVVARFEAERQALALMDHPNIAQVFDAGTANGKPYFVMELVHGVPVTQFCKDHDVALRERLELFIHICNAVQHAHQKGIIHRDLKPPNVLVTEHDGKPVVKVIDFGVAKAISEPLTAKEIQTHFAQLIGTPLYMSPEQIELSGLDVDTRSDIYSLGVLLYEMLTGITPYDQQRLATVSFDELRRIIREEEPPRPSAHLTTIRSDGSSATTVDPRSRASSLELRGDLDWIVMKALEKERERRYETAAELAADIRRFLNQEPIIARPPSPFYRFGKFARRNKIVLSAATLVLITLVVTTGISTYLAIRATAAQAEADRLKQETIDAAENLKQANVLLDNARANADNSRWATAYQQHTLATQLQPDHYPVWSGRAGFFVRLGLWNWAAADYSTALELGARANNPGWWGVPQLCLYAGDEQAYRASANQMLGQFKDSSDSIFKAVGLRACLMKPGSHEQSAELVKLAEDLFDNSDFERREFRPGDMPRSPRGRGRGGLPDRKMPQPSFSEMGPRPGSGFGGLRGPGSMREMPIYVTGLAHLRAGSPDRAIERLESLPSYSQRGTVESLAAPVLAMAYHDVGRSADARSTLEWTQQLHDQWLESMVESETLGWMPIPWFDFLEHTLLYREAHQRITGKELPEDPRWATLERRALEALGSPNQVE